MIFELSGGGAKKYAVARPIHVSNSHTKFGWISSNGLGGDSVTDGRTDGRTDGQTDGRTDGRTEAIAISPTFFLKRGDNNYKINHCLYSSMQFETEIIKKN